MDTDQIKSGLTSLYDKGQRIVFWHDPDGEFAEMVPDLDLGDVSILRLEETPSLEAKVAIELEQPDTRFLIYETGNQPTPEKDWLLDIRLYADAGQRRYRPTGLFCRSLFTTVSTSPSGILRLFAMARGVKPADSAARMSEV